MGFDDLRASWNRFGERDPMWAVLTWPGTSGTRWRRSAFFEFGRDEVGRILDQVETIASAAGAPLRYGHALDFGCGVGRLTQALARRFKAVDGLDIAESMLQTARRWNRMGDRCQFHLVHGADLPAWTAGRYDLVLSAHVLQHVEPELTSGYVRGLVRALRPGGCAMLQIVTEPVTGAGMPLPDTACRAQVRLLDVPRRLAPGAPAAVRVEVTNCGDRAWPAAGRNGWGQVQVGNHWTPATPAGQTQVDDARAGLPDDLPPGARCTVVLDVCAPSSPGRWLLDVDVVQEGVAWFADHGSSPARAPVRVRGRAKPAPDFGDARMEMHGLAESSLAAWATEAGGHLAGSFDWDLVQRPFSRDWHRRGVVIIGPTGPAAPREPHLSG